MVTSVAHGIAGLRGRKGMKCQWGEMAEGFSAGKPWKMVGFVSVAESEIDFSINRVCAERVLVMWFMSSGFAIRSVFLIAFAKIRLLFFVLLFQFHRKWCRDSVVYHKFHTNTTNECN